MPRHLWSLLCQNVITDGPTNQVSYINAVEEYAVPRLPYRGMPVTLATLWARTNDEPNLAFRLRVLAPDGKELVTHSFGPQPWTTPRWRINVGLAGYPIEVAGEYNIVVEAKDGQKWREVSRLPIIVRLGKPEELASAPLEALAPAHPSETPTP